MSTQHNKLSTIEYEVTNYIKRLDPSLFIINNDRKQIYPYELDIYLPELRIGIECNPTYTHNSSINMLDTDKDPVPRNYHKHKSDECMYKGISLIHVFSYDWNHRANKIKSIIAKAIGVPRTVIYANSCCIKKISYNSCKRFLIRNHIKGPSNSNIHYGLYYEDKLVSVMLFRKDKHSTSDDHFYEIVRYADKLFVDVVGGFDRFLDTFIAEYCPVRIRAIQNRTYESDVNFMRFGFYRLENIDPKYMWVDIKTDTPYLSICAKKSTIHEFLSDNTIDTKSHSEKVIMESHGYVRVYDAGYVLWEYLKRR